MPSRSVSLGRLVLLGVLPCVLAFPLLVPRQLREIHESITSDLGLTGLEINREPLFDSVIRTINTSCQRKDDMQLLNATLDVYMRIFSNVLHRNQHGSSHLGGLLDRLEDSKRQKVLSDLKNLKRMMEDLKRHLICQNQKREDVLGQLDKIKVDDPMVQKKALAQFLQIYQAASTVVASNAASE